MPIRLFHVRRGKPLLLRPSTNRPVTSQSPPRPRHLPQSTCEDYQRTEQRHVSTRCADLGGYMEQNPELYKGQITIEPERKQLKQLFASNRTRRRVPTPPVLLGQYLDARDASEKERLIGRVADYLKPSRLPSILLGFLHKKSKSKANSTLNTGEAPTQDAILATSFSDLAEKYMKKRKLAVDDVAHWAWIVSGKNADEMIERFLSSSQHKPQFVLAEILRRDIQHVKSLSNILQYLLTKRTTTIHADLFPVYLDEPNDNAFGVLASRLLSQARRIWPPALMSITHMIHGYFNFVMANTADSENKLRKSARLTKLLNYFIDLLSLPSAANPLSSSRHNWNAQKKLLELAGSFDPPLLLSQSGYRSIVKTLVASKKSDVESKSALLRTRSWPPWRQDQDGMDARRLFEEDFSRVISATSKMQEAGFRLEDVDEAAQIYGGMESDGTPTIQTRRIMRKPRLTSSDDHMSSQVWTARIQATRDVQEAWGAFLEFQTRNGTPSQDVFLAMFEKINYHSANKGRKRAHTAAPGDGKEVMPVWNVNFTDYYIQRFQAPSLHTLYREMLDCGICPSGKCLEFLIKTARTTDEGLQYMLDAGIDGSAVVFLAATPTHRQFPKEMEKVPERVLNAYIDLICRLAPRTVFNRSRQAASTKLNPTSRSSDSPTSAERIHAERMPTIWSTLVQRPKKLSQRRQRETLKQVSFLLKKTSTMFRPSWYAYFRALAREGAIIPKEVIGNDNWDSLAWVRLAGALKDFHSFGLELDPQGFLYICAGFEKFARESFSEDVSPRIFGPSKDPEIVASRGVEIVKAAFVRLYESQKECQEIPTLLHAIRGVHLHAYVRALGAVDDHESIFSALEWMVEHNEELEAIAEENKNSFLGFGKTVVAIRYLLSGTTFEESAKELVERVNWWDGWPSDEQVVSYLQAPSDLLEEGISGEEDFVEKKVVKYPTHS